MSTTAAFRQRAQDVFNAAKLANRPDPGLAPDVLILADRVDQLTEALEAQHAKEGACCCPGDRCLL